MSSRSGMWDNLLPVFRSCLSVCVCKCMCEHSLHDQASELSAQRGVTDCWSRSTQWTLVGQFILHHYLVLKDHSAKAGADCLQSFVRTQTRLLSSSQSLIYPLNPLLIHCLWVPLTESCNKFVLCAVGWISGQIISYVWNQGFSTSLTQFFGPHNLY